jgi:hypothetical protein
VRIRNKERTIEREPNLHIGGKGNIEIQVPAVPQDDAMCHYYSFGAMVPRTYTDVSSDTSHASYISPNSSVCCH